jgi:site-specific DNA-cytosine methylase
MRLKPVTYRVGHLFCGIGAGAKGFNDAQPRVKGLSARFECAGGVDWDAGAIANFTRITGTRGTVLDLFDRQQYRDYHGHEPPAGWHEAMPVDIRRAHGRKPLHVMFLSPPCKGFSGLLSTRASEALKYQALNRLTVRGIWLTLEAYKDDPVDVILLENVPRIETRGRALLEEIKQLLRAYGYISVESKHDCGEIGNLAETRKRFLLVARHASKVPNFVYQPTKSRLRGVGEVIGLLPLPGDPVAGIMHRVPQLQWKTWVRLAFVPAGKDWRALNDLAVENGVLRDFGIVPEQMRDNQLGVLGWGDTCPTITSQRAPGQGRFSVADPRVPEGLEGTGRLGVRDWSQPTGTIPGASRPDNGAHSVADPREHGRHHGSLGVKGWEEPANLVAGATRPSNGPHSVADPRTNDMMKGGLGVVDFDQPSGVVAGDSMPTNGRYAVADPRPTQENQTYSQYGVREWEEPASTVTGQALPGGGPNSVADPRLLGKPRFNNVFRVVEFGETSPAVAGPGGTGLAVADPRADGGFGGKGKYRITGFDEATGTVIGGSTTGQGAFAVADPRGGDDPTKLHGKHRVEGWDDPSRAVIAGRDNGASAVADPRPTHGPGAHQNKHKVVGYDEPAPVVTGSDRVGSGALSVADPRTGYGEGAHHNILAVTPYDGPAKTITGANHVTGAALSVADPRPGYTDAHHNVLRVTPYDQPAGTVTSGHGPTTGAISVADPRPVALNGEHRDGYSTQGHYGVVSWDEWANAVPGYAKHDRGVWSVADPREQGGEPIEALPKPSDRLVARIIARDGTWHRPFTTLDLAAIQSIFDPTEIFECVNGVWQMVRDFHLEGGSDQVRREWIGNAVPPAAARGMAETIGETLLLAGEGESFALDSRQIWVKPLALALSVDSRQEVHGVLC